MAWAEPWLVLAFAWEVDLRSSFEGEVGGFKTGCLDFPITLSVTIIINK